jgi:hypothetical protein
MPFPPVDSGREYPMRGLDLEPIGLSGGGIESEG